MGDWRGWAHGLGAAFIGGVAAAAPDALGAGPVSWKSTGIAALLAGIVAAAGYLKASPLPKRIEEVETVKVTKTETKVD